MLFVKYIESMDIALVKDFLKVNNHTNLYH